MNEIVSLPGQKATSSREIADLCRARHNDVAATIPRLLERGILQESCKTPPTIQIEKTKMCQGTSSHLDTIKLVMMQTPQVSV